MIVNLNAESFDKAIRSSVPVLVDFWAVWCGPCMMQGEVLHEVDAAHPSVQIAKVNVDEEQALAARFGISAIPTMIVFREGKAVETVCGLRPAEEIVELLRRNGASL